MVLELYSSTPTLQVTNTSQAVRKPVSIASKQTVPVLSHADGLEVTELCQLCEKSPADTAVVKRLQCEIFYCDLCKEKSHPARGPLSKHNLINLKRSSKTPFQSQMEKPRVFRHNKFPPLPNKPSSKNGLKLATCTQHSSIKRVCIVKRVVCPYVFNAKMKEDTSLIASSRLEQCFAN